MKRITLALAVACASYLSGGVSLTQAMPQPAASRIAQGLANIPILELIPQATHLVRQTPPEDRRETVVTVVRVVLARRPALAVSLVESVARAFPELAATLTQAAVELCPKQSVEIARAAALAAPNHAAEIAVAAALRSQDQTRQIARFVVAASPIDAPEILEAILVAVPSQRSSIESDLALNVVSALARNTRAAGARALTGLIGQKPLPNAPGTPTPVTQVTAEVRSAKLEEAVTQLKNLETSSSITSKTLQSDITIATINALNAIGRESDMNKQEKDAVINSMISTVITVIADATITEANRVNVIKTTAQVIAAIVSDPGLNDAVKKDYVNFATSTVKAFLADSNLNNSTIIENKIKEVAGEVSKAIESARSKTADEAQAGLAKAQENVNAIKKNYGAPN